MNKEDKNWLPDISPAGTIKNKTVYVTNTSDQRVKDLEELVGTQFIYISLLQSYQEKLNGMSELKVGQKV